MSDMNIIDDLQLLVKKTRSEMEMQKQVCITLRLDMNSVEEHTKQSTESLNKRLDLLTERPTNEKKRDLSMPVSLDISKKSSAMEEEILLDAMDKMKDMLAAEIKRIEDRLFKITMDFESKVRAKIDKHDLEDIESKYLRYDEVLIIYFRAHDVKCGDSGLQWDKEIHWQGRAEEI